MYQEKFEIIINTDKKLTISDLLEIRLNLFSRLQGYSTVCPDSLSNSNASIELKYVNIKKTRKLKLLNINNLL